MSCRRSSAATKCISDVPGLAKQVSTPSASSASQRWSAPVFMSLRPLSSSRPSRLGETYVGRRLVRSTEQRTPGNGLEQLAGVSVLRRAEYRLRLTLLDDFAAPHHHDPVG